VTRRTFFRAGGLGALVALSAGRLAGAQEFKSVSPEVEKANIRVVNDFCAALKSRDVAKATSLLADKCAYRPPTLSKVAEKLSALNPKDLGVGEGRPENLGSYELYQVERDDTLSGIANKFYKDPSAWPRLFAANLDQLEDADHIYPGQVLKIPQA